MYRIKMFIHKADGVVSFKIKERKYDSIGEAAKDAQTITMVLWNYGQIDCSYIILNSKNEDSPATEEENDPDETGTHQHLCEAFKEIDWWNDV